MGDGGRENKVPNNLHKFASFLAQICIFRASGITQNPHEPGRPVGILALFVSQQSLCMHWCQSFAFGLKTNVK